MSPRPVAVLFDLDGTLIDSAPDLAAAANAMRAERGLPPVAYGRLRPLAGSGARGMLAGAFGIGPGHADYERLRGDFLDRYEAVMFERTAPFHDVPGLLQALEAASLRWGIVTNKALRFAGPLVARLPALQGAAALVGGDSTPHTKPHPAPLLEAARQLAVAPADCLYVGDDERDMRAGRAAGMRTLAAAWGYLGAEAEVARWPADAVLQSPEALLPWLGLR